MNIHICIYLGIYIYLGIAIYIYIYKQYTVGTLCTYISLDCNISDTTQNA